MQRVTVGRYSALPGFDVPDHCDISGSGWIEGVRDDGSEWIMFTDTTGSPTVFWGERDESGAVVGVPISLGI